MRLIQETNNFKIYMGTFSGKPCRFILDKRTKERTMHLEDVAKCLGFKNSEEMFSNDEILDAFSSKLKKDPRSIQQTVIDD